MGRLLAIDYGTKRVGLAVTDPLQLIATALETVPTKTILKYLKSYALAEQVDAFIVGAPLDLKLEKTDSTDEVKIFIKHLKRNFPYHMIHLHDERYTSKMALAAMISAGSRKKDRRKKENIDKVSATIILQSFIESQSFKK